MSGAGTARGHGPGTGFGGSSVERIALVKLSSLGDVVHTLPVAHALRAEFPRAELTWVVERRERAILDGNPDVDHILAVDTRLWRRELRHPTGARAVLGKLRGLVRRLRAGRFDVALDVQGLWKSGAITWLTRARMRVGFVLGECRERANVLFTTHRIPVWSAAAHVVDANLALLRALGLAPERLGRPVFPLPADPAAERAIAQYLEVEGVKPDTPLVVLNAGAGAAGKRWAVDAHRRLGDELAVRLGARTLLCWGPGEEPLARAVGRGMRAAPLIPPATSIPELVALLRRATLVVGGDTGPIHIAATLGVPTIGLYGPTSARRNGPFGPRAATVQSPTGRMDGISVEAVLVTTERLFR